MQDKSDQGVATAPWNNPSLGDLAAAYAAAGYDKEAKEIVVKLGERDPNFIQNVRKFMDAHDDPTFKAECARIIEGPAQGWGAERPSEDELRVDRVCNATAGPGKGQSASATRLASFPLCPRALA